jgi:hypothetical protein
MPRIREFCSKDDDHFEIEEIQKEIAMERLNYHTKTEQKLPTDRLLFSDHVHQTQSTSDLLKFKAMTPPVVRGSRSIYISIPQMRNYRY